MELNKIVQSISSCITARFRRLFDIGAARCSRGTRSVPKGQVLGKYWGDAGFGHYTWHILPPLSIDYARYQVGIMDSDGDEQD